MKFEFDHRTGSMQPKKDDNIYFAQSQGGGLIVDDKKNNIRYIIERDERITKLFGSFDRDKLNFYDMRDARMIADRVVRLLGRDHKYSDFHYFLKGYHMSENFVQSCSSFLDESVWADIHKRSNGQGTVKKEDYGKVIGTLEDGTKLVMPYDYVDKGELVEFDEGKLYYEFEEGGIIAVVSQDYDDAYYVYNEDDEGVNMSCYCIIDDCIRKEDEFNSLLAIANTSNTYLPDLLFNLEVDVQREYTKFTFDGGRESYMLFYSEDRADDYAFDSEKELLDDTRFDKETVKRFRDILGDGFFDEKAMKDELEESYSTYFDDLNNEDKVRELLNYGLVEETEEYFDVDEDGDVDTDLPTFDPDDYRDNYVEKVLDSIDDVINEFFTQYGYDGIEDFIDIEELAKDIVNNDGRGSIISGYDGQERVENVNGKTYYIYRT
jgi:hypothetical protein